MCDVSDFPNRNIYVTIRRRLRYSIWLGDHILVISSCTSVLVVQYVRTSARPTAIETTRIWQNAVPFRRIAYAEMKPS